MPPSPKPYIFTFLHCLFGAVSQSCLRYCLPGCSPPWTCNSHIVHLFSQQYYLSRLGHFERVAGRKARGLQMEEIGCKCQMFFIFFLSRKRKQTTSVRFSSLLYTNIKRGFSENSVPPNDSWFHLNLTFLKPWANQCVFLMEMFFLSYVNELCIYPRLSFFKSVPPKTQNQ